MPTLQGEQTRIRAADPQPQPDAARRPARSMAARMRDGGPARIKTADALVVNRPPQRDLPTESGDDHPAG
jgi:hypothetical protein